MAAPIPGTLYVHGPCSSWRGVCEIMKVVGGSQHFLYRHHQSWPDYNARTPVSSYTSLDDLLTNGHWVLFGPSVDDGL